MSITADDLGLLRYFGNLPRRNNRVKLDISKLSETLGSSEAKVLEKLTLYQSMGLIRITGIPNDDSARNKLVQLVRQIDYRYLAGKITDVDYDAMRRAATEVVLGIPNTSLQNIPPSPILMGDLIRRRSQLISSLLNLVNSKDYDAKTIDEILRSLREIEGVIEEIEGREAGFGGDTLAGLRTLREKVEEDLLRAVIGELGADALAKSIEQAEETLDEMVQALGRYFLTEGLEKRVPSFLEIELELLRTRLNLGEITKEEYDYLYQDLLRKSKSAPTADSHEYIKVIEESIRKLKEQLESLKGIRTREQKLDKSLFEIMESRTQKTVLLLGEIGDEIKRIAKLLEQARSVVSQQ
jgi:uncharacterized membrane protein